MYPFRIKNSFVALSIATRPKPPITRKLTLTNFYLYFWDHQYTGTRRRSCRCLPHDVYLWSVEHSPMLSLQIVDVATTPTSTVHAPVVLALLFCSLLACPAVKFRAGRFDAVDAQADRPLIAQFCGNDPDTVVRAARHVEGRCDGVDLNLGCPQKIAKKGNYGAFLLSNPQLCEDIVSAMSRYDTSATVTTLRDKSSTLE